MSIVTKTAARKGQLVNSKHVDNLLANYKKERWMHNTKRLGKEDSLSVTFGINEIGKFMKLARENGADCVRVYFGVYPEGFEQEPIYGGRQTIVLVAIKEKINAEGGVVTKHIYYQGENGPEILAFNAGAICPPVCPSSTGLPDDGGYSYIVQDQGLGLAFVSNENGDTVVL